MKNKDEYSVKYLDAQRKVKELKGFYVHVIAYVLINLFLILTSAYTNGQFNFGEIEIYFTALFWGIGLLAHGLSVFTTTKIFSKAWEERKMEHYMEEFKNLNK